MLSDMASPAALPVMDSPFSQLAKPAPFPEGASSSIVHVNKDASKRKRVNRSAKLKQCKLDARREQWLSQVATGKHSKFDQEPHMGVACTEDDNKDYGEVVHPEDCILSSQFSESKGQHFSLNDGRTGSPTQLRITRNENCTAESKKDHEKLGVDTHGSSPSASSCTFDYFEADSSPKSCGDKSPKSKVTRVGRGGRGRNDSKTEKDPAVPAVEREQEKAGSTLAVDNYSANMPQSRVHLPDLDVDDWEAAADALDLSSPQDVTSAQSQELVEQLSNSSVQSEDPQIVLKPETSKLPSSMGVISRSASGRAWRPDDACRPPSLPSLNKQQSLPAHFDNQQQRWSVTQKFVEESPVAPLQCPICTEELDSTDSSFDPCSCGFQLCLFCHHRIVAEDGRCPGCRKAYSNSLPKKPAVSTALH